MITENIKQLEKLVNSELASKVQKSSIKFNELLIVSFDLLTTFPITLITDS
mgnify:CR=1 FL=1